MNTCILYFNQCKEDLGPLKKLMVFLPHIGLLATFFLWSRDLYRVESILFYPLFNWTLILSCSDMYYFFYEDFIPLFFCFVGKFMTIFISEFLQLVYTFPLLSEKNNGKRGKSDGRQAIQFLAKFTLGARAQCQSLLLTRH